MFSFVFQVQWNTTKAMRDSSSTDHTDSSRSVHRWQQETDSFIIWLDQIDVRLKEAKDDPEKLKVSLLLVLLILEKKW